MILDVDDTKLMIRIILEEHRRHHKDTQRPELWATIAANKIAAALSMRASL